MFEGKEGSHPCWCLTELTLAVDCGLERRHLEAGRQGWMGKHKGLKEGGGREMKRRGQFSEKP